MKRNCLLFVLMFLILTNIYSDEKKGKFVKIFDKLYKVYFMQQKTSEDIKKEKKFVSLY